MARHLALGDIHGCINALFDRVFYESDWIALYLERVSGADFQTEWSNDV